MSCKNSAIKFAKSIRARIFEDKWEDENQNLLFARFYGEFLRSNHLGIYSDIEIEDFLLNKYQFLGKDKVHNPEGDILQLLTTPLPYGGHTRVVENLLSIGVGNGVAALDEIPSLVLDRIPTGICVKSKLREVSGVKTIAKILDVLLTFRRVTLHIHPDDIYSTIASGIASELGVEVYFYNHADHGFCYGYGRCKSVFEISKYGWLKGVQRGVDHKQSFVGIPAPEISSRAIYRPSYSKLKILIAGSAAKFKPWKEYSIPKLIEMIFKTELLNNTQITICGTDGEDSYWDNIKSLKSENIKFLGRVNHSQYIEILKASDLYIDSFPQGNGTGFVEAVMQGIPSLGMNILAGCSWADTLRQKNIYDLLRAILQVQAFPESYVNRITATVKSYGHSSLQHNKSFSLLFNDILVNKTALIEIELFSIQYFS